jgi:hypothetical protein
MDEGLQDRKHLDPFIKEASIEKKSKLDLAEMQTQLG